MAISGPVPSIEADPAHLRFVDVVRPEATLLNLTEARRLLNRDSLTAAFPEETALITTSTVADRHASEWGDELDLIRTLQPTLHIPADGPVYTTQQPIQRGTTTLDCLEGAAWMRDQLAGTETDVLPLLKGIHPRERELCYRVFDRLGYKQCAFYAGQYFSGGAGPVELAHDLTQITEATDCTIVGLGVLAPGCLRRLPEAVTAAAGINAWREAVEPQSATDSELRERYDRFVAEVEDALRDSSRQPERDESHTAATADSITQEVH